MDGKKVWKKTGFGILFVAACFIAMYILMEFHGNVLMISIAAVLLLLTAFLFLNAVFSDKAKKWAPQEEEAEEAEIISNSSDGEFRLKIAKHMKEMEGTQKELITLLKNQNTLLQEQIENLEHEIYMLSEKQVNQSKALIKYNKENARQLAISERETLEYVLYEIKQAMEETKGRVAASELEEVSEEELFAVSDLAGDEEMVMPEAEPAVEEKAEEPVPSEEPMVDEPAVEMDIPDMPEDIDLSELFDIPELFEESAAENPVEEVPVAEEKAEEPAIASDPLAGLSADPNAMMTPEDIAKLLAAMGQ